MNNEKWKMENCDVAEFNDRAAYYQIDRYIIEWQLSSRFCLFLIWFYFSTAINASIQRTYSVENGSRSKYSSSYFTPTWICFSSAISLLYDLSPTWIQSSTYGNHSRKTLNSTISQYLMFISENITNNSASSSEP